MRAEANISFAQLQKATGIKDAQLERLFRNEATFNIEDFTSIVLALGGDPQTVLGAILEKVRIQ